MPVLIYTGQAPPALPVDTGPGTSGASHRTARRQDPLAGKRALTPKAVADALTAAHITVHHVATKRVTPGDRVVFVVFLEENRGQHAVARYYAGKLPGVLDVTFHPGTFAVMYVLARAPAAR
jgi:TRAP-type mannitol/chloroaromatic compound transport system substrate-binding protein